MSRHRRPRFFLLALAASALAPTLPAQFVDYVWTGRSSSDWFQASNWAGGSVPLNDDANTRVFFGAGSPTSVVFDDVPLGINRFTISGNTEGYRFLGSFSDMVLGSGGFVYSPAQPVRSVIYTDYNIEFSADQTWDIASGMLELDGFVYDGDNNYVFTKTGAGALAFARVDNEFDYSILNLNDGRLVVTGSGNSSDRPLGYTDLNIGPTGSSNPVLVARGSGGDDSNSVFLDNYISLNGGLVTENQTELHLTGYLTLNADTTMSPRGRWLFVEGNIDELGGARKLTVDTPSAVVLVGTNTYTGGTHATSGPVIFAALSALPATGSLSSDATGYIGMGDDGTSTPYDLQTAFIDRFDKPNTFGTIGVDTDPSLSPTSFTSDINLAGFAASARLGSATTAGITGTITPQGADYRFGGGGGMLNVGSLLTGARGLVLDSPVGQALTVWLNNSSNDFTGSVSVANSALLFNGNAPLPAGTYTMDATSYIGRLDPTDTPAEMTGFLGHFAAGTSGVIGFDSLESNTFASAIDLSGFTGAVYLGSSTTNASLVTLTGPITAASGGTAPFRFAGYKGGWLNVSSDLTGFAGVVIGDPDSPATFGDFNNRVYSTVELAGDNSALTGDVTFYGGQLVVDRSPLIPSGPTTSLGSGSLIVNGTSFPSAIQANFIDNEAPARQLAAAFTDLVIPNDVTLNAELIIGGDYGFTLAGVVSGAGELYVDLPYIDPNYPVLTLSGANTFAGGLYISSGSRVNLVNDTSAGTGGLAFGQSGGVATFESQSPAIKGLFSDTYSTVSLVHQSATLTIDQAANSTYFGELRADSFGTGLGGRFLKTGPGTLRIENGGIYSYGLDDGLGNNVSLEIQQGTVVLANNAYMENGAVKLAGGTLALDGNAFFGRPVVLQSGTLAGAGTFTVPITVGAGAGLSPGFSPGILSFSAGLTLAGAGTLDFEIESALGPAGTGYDLVSVSGAVLDITATNLSPFMLKIISLDGTGAPGALGDFSPATPYTWTLAISSAGINGFSSDKFAIDASSFVNGLAGGVFYLTQGVSGSDSTLLLNFAPVPEPSTYALLALGLCTVGISLRRRRRPSA